VRVDVEITRPHGARTSEAIEADSLVDTLPRARRLANVPDDWTCDAMLRTGNLAVLVWRPSP
jgi:hypothetical protein